MVFHVVALPHTNTTSDFVVCAFTEKVRKFCNMMKSLGHTVYLYGGTVTDAACDELITCISEADRSAHVGSGHYTEASFDYTLPAWVNFNNRAIEEIAKRAGEHDFIGLMGGLAQKQVADAFPEMISVEIGIGYGGTFAKYRVWESYAWMHTCYGSANPNPNAIDGLFYDAIIPASLEVEKFPFEEHKDDYCLYIGRLTERKGAEIAAEACKRLGKRLLVAGGSGTPPEYGEYVGIVDEGRRASLMSKAAAVFVPTIYVEPFGTVAIEAMMCGTPVISTDWGGMSDTNVHGLTGYRCRTLGEFMWAANNVASLDPHEIRKHAESLYSMDVIAKKYQAYFERLETLWTDGWYSELSWLSR